jgi:hypothetical protein
MLERGSVRRHDRLVSPTGTRWTVIKTWTRGHGGEIWYKVQSERGRIQNKMFFEIEDWNRAGDAR